MIEVLKWCLVVFLALVFIALILSFLMPHD